MISNEDVAYGPQIGMDDPWVMERENDAYFFQTDHLNSVTELTDENEAVQNEYRYKAFGEALAAVEMVENEYQFTARRRDGVDGIQFNRYRHYQPEFGRWNQWDRIRYDDGANMYAYVGNNPVVLTDSLGLTMFTGTYTYTPPSGPPGGSYIPGTVIPSSCPGMCSDGSKKTFSSCYSACSASFWYLKPVGMLTKGASWLWGSTASGIGLLSGSATLIKAGTTVAKAGTIIGLYPSAFYVTYCTTKCSVDPCAY